MVAALDHVDGVDLHIAQMLDGPARGLRPAAERRRFVKPLRAQPYAQGEGGGEGDGSGGAAGHDLERPSMADNRVQQLKSA